MPQQKKPQVSSKQTQAKPKMPAPKGFEASLAGHSEEGRRRYIEVMQQYMMTRPWELAKTRWPYDEKLAMTDPERPVLRQGERPTQLGRRARAHVRRDEFVRYILNSDDLSDREKLELMHKYGFSNPLEEPWDPMFFRTSSKPNREAYEIAVKESVRRGEMKPPKHEPLEETHIASTWGPKTKHTRPPYLPETSKEYQRYAADLSSDYPKKRPEDLKKQQPPKEKYVPIRLGQKGSKK